MNGSCIVGMRACARRPAVFPVNYLVALVAPSQAKVTEGRPSEKASGLHGTLFLAGLTEALVEKGDALGALR